MTSEEQYKDISKRLGALDQFLLATSGCELMQKVDMNGFRVYRLTTKVPKGHEVIRTILLPCPSCMSAVDFEDDGVKYKRILTRARWVLVEVLQHQQLPLAKIDAKMKGYVEELFRDCPPDQLEVYLEGL